MREKGGNFKINIHLNSVVSFLYCLYSSSNAVLGADNIRGRRLLEVFLIFLSKIRGADIIRGGILLEGISSDSQAIRNVCNC